MTGIGPEHVNDMAKLIAAMNAGEDAPARVTPTILAEESTGHPFAQSTRAPAPVTPDIEAMGRIMSAFAAATDDVVASAESYPELKKALVTEATETGVRIGSWEISSRDVAGYGKCYDVNHAITQEPIATDLRLYEAALALVNAFNEGDTITSMRIKTILNVEDEYSRALTDAVQFASRMKVTEGASHAVAEARYSRARERALTAKKSLIAISKLF